MKEMKVEGNDLNDERLMGFVKITELGDAQQTTVNTKLLAKLTKFLGDLEKMGFSHVTITVQNNKPIIVGGKEIGMGIAPYVSDY